MPALATCVRASHWWTPSSQLARAVPTHRRLFHATRLVARQGKRGGSGSNGTGSGSNGTGSGSNGTGSGSNGTGSGSGNSGTGSGSGKSGNGTGKSGNGNKKAPRERKDDAHGGEDGTASTTGNALAKGLNQLQRALSVVENSVGQELRGLRGAAGKDFPETVALPVGQRPLFPGFYRAINITDREMIDAVRQTLERGKPYVSVFLARSSATSAAAREAASRSTGKDGTKRPSLLADDVLRISSPDDIHKVGVFSQIHNLIAGPNGSVTVLVFPLHRVKYRELKIRAVASGVDDDDEEEEAAEEEEDDGDTEHGDAVTPKSRVLPTTDATVKRPSSTKASPSSALTKPPVTVVVEALRDEPADASFDQYRPAVKALLDTINDITRLNPLVREQTAEFMRAIGSVNDVYSVPGKLADFAAAMSDADADDLQQILECVDVRERLEQSLLLLKRELINAELQSRVSRDLDGKISDKDREYFLKERLKVIQKELGMETDSREKVVEKYERRAAKVQMPDAVKKVFDEELGKLAHLRPSAQEYNLTTTYLDWLTNVPWGLRSDENFDVQHAQTVLDEDHFGMRDVKERIMEFIAVGKLKGSVQGKILCLAGPPGVGKTSIGKSIARALQRKYYRFSVGGLYDVAEIKGHRRTYVGAMPGKLVQALKTVQTENPLILIDEIDKVARGGHTGDPSSALLEVLDPEQNNSFLDHYLDVPVDLSRVLFVCTANQLDTIPGPLLDRMEVIDVSGYTNTEKHGIASKYLIPDAVAGVGLTPEQLVIKPETIDAILHHYCRESGVRNLKKQIEKICRKAAFKRVVAQADSDAERVVVGEEAATSTGEIRTDAATVAGSEDANATQSTEVLPTNLREYLGNEVFMRDRLYERTPKGVIMGLAYSQMGGSALYIESASSLSSGRSATDMDDDNEDDEDKARGGSTSTGIQPTGNIGSVMKESTDIAYSYARSLLRTKLPTNRFFDRHAVHLHVPEGATPKDGPSAGVAMCSSLLSLALDRPAAIDVAMTGELTLTGRVLKIGGVKEKTMAAKRAGARHVIMPAGNRTDFEELEPHVREGLDAHFVETYEEVYQLLFPDVPKQKGKETRDENVHVRRSAATNGTD